MAKQPEKALFEYLRDILYRTDYACLDMAEIPEAFKPLAQGLHWLHQCVKEQKAFGEDLAQGDLDATPPGVENTLAAPLKAVQGSLKHIAWQARQLPKGDYGQHIDYMGEFADILNTMVDQLAAQHQALLDEKHLVEEQNKILGQYYSLFLSLRRVRMKPLLCWMRRQENPSTLIQRRWFLKKTMGIVWMLSDISWGRYRKRI